MQTIHSLNLIHRDIKSANILIRNKSDPKKVKAAICDFGLVFFFYSILSLFVHFHQLI